MIKAKELHVSVGYLSLFLFHSLFIFPSAAVSFQQLLERHMEREKKQAEEEERADDALTKAAFETVRGHIKRLRDDPSDEEDNTVMPTRENKALHTSSAPSTTSRAKLQNLVKKKSVVQPQPDAKASSSLSLLGAYSDDSD